MRSSTEQHRVPGRAPWRKVGTEGVRVLGVEILIKLQEKCKYNELLKY